MKTWSRRLTLIFALATPSTAIAADKPAAQAAFDLGKQLMLESRYPEACPKFEESLRLEPGVGTMLYLAACYEAVGRLASAWAEFRGAQALATRIADPRAALARERADKLEPRLARLAIVVPPSLRAIAGLEVKRDDALVGTAVFDAPIPVDPGPHRVVVTAPGRKFWSSDVNVAAQDTKASLRLPDSLEGEPRGPTRVASANGTPDAGDAGKGSSGSSGDALRLGGVIAGGVGVVGMGLSLGFGLSAKSKNDDSNAGDHCRGNLCDAAGLDARNAARDAATVSTVAFVVGLAGLGAGATLYFTAPKPSAPAQGAAVSAWAPWLSAGGGGASVRGQF